MRGTSSLGIVVIVVIGFAVSCSHAPQLERTSEQVAGFRSQYLEHHPDDRFKKQILKNEVHKEMNFMQVLAAWGLPNVRNGVDEQGSETWGYFAVDKHSKEVKRYDLVFNRSRLIGWLISDDPGLGLLNPEDLTGLPVMSTGGMSPSELGSMDKQ